MSENNKFTLDLPFPPKIIKVYGGSGEMWSWMSGVKDEWKQEIDKLKEKSLECESLIKTLKSLGASDEEIILHMKNFEKEE